MYKVKFLYRWRETNIFQVYYSICKGLNYFFPSMTLEKIYQMTREKLYLSPLLKNGHSQITSELRLRMGKFSLLYANIAAKWNTMISCKRQGLETLKALP